ncbi:PREDICTED: carnosine N-methyltransferase-like [Priapulus caudatus]|uniref:carnosine N-methyltransferase n=1 Tax=Priapulus caudatus TaxID=37621 RepID=A0ABM1F0X7_PRICU|nr:PREDICTED: carnosine N-methyltransferase-like [Priapulus caudatus]XP_014678099.1 PREDICTED: carnosine N-methyltransferase-like [Priapulus caudatus]
MNGEEDEEDDTHSHSTQTPCVPLTLDEEEESREREHFHRIVNAFRYYRKHSYLRIARAEHDFRKLSERHKLMCPTFTEHLNEVRLCVDHNYEVIKQIVANTDHMFENIDYWLVQQDDQATTDKWPLASSADMDKVHSTMKQFVRDWSVEGEHERLVCYQPVLDEILAHFPPDKSDMESVMVLVPGAGLGRLAYEIARLGYTCQGNEWSLFMLFASNFVLNRCREVEMITIFPWVQQYQNRKANADQIRPCKIPDINPAVLPPGANFSMAAGDFLEIYKSSDAWHCVSTVFFIDTARNVMEYIEKIWKILRPGGIWINMGPLLYHYSDMEGETSIELSYEEIRNVMVQIGFDILKEREDDVTVPYSQNPRSMMKHVYDCVFFVARKPTFVPLEDPED